MTTSAEDLPRPSRLSVQHQRRRSARRFYWHTLASTLLPGAGLIGTRRRVVGIVFTTTFLLATLGFLAWAWTSGIVKTALGIAVRPGLLTTLLVIVAVMAVLWCAGIVATARHTRPADRVNRGIRAVRLGFVVLCCGLVVAPSALAANYLAIQRSVVDTVFTGPGSGPALAGSGKTNPWEGTPRVNVLLLGSDAGRDRVGVRTDSMMVASINTVTGDTVLIGVPRNLENAPIPRSNPLSKLYPYGFSCGDVCLLNAIWQTAEEHKDLFPKSEKNPGLTSTRDVVGAVLGLDLQRTVVIDLKGFKELVDAMGGVDINVREKVSIGGKVVNGQIIDIKGWINPGRQHMDGFHALWYARSRATTDDFSRMRRQRCVAAALISQADAPKLLRRYPALAKVIKDNITVNIPQDELEAWVYLVDVIQTKGRIRSLPITDKVISPANPDYTLIHSLVRKALRPPKAARPSGPSSSSSGSPSSSRSPSSSPSDKVSDVTDTC